MEPTIRIIVYGTVLLAPITVVGNTTSLIWPMAVGPGFGFGAR